MSGAKIISFSGQPKAASVSSGDIDIGKSIVTLAKPIVDNGSATVSVASRSLLNETVSYGAPVTADSENRCSLRSNGNYHRLKVTPTGANWETVIGTEVEIVKQGTR